MTGKDLSRRRRIGVVRLVLPGIRVINTSRRLKAAPFSQRARCVARAGKKREQRNPRGRIPPLTESSPLSTSGKESYFLLPSVHFLTSRHDPARACSVVGRSGFISNRRHQSRAACLRDAVDTWSVNQTARERSRSSLLLGGHMSSSYKF